MPRLTIPFVEAFENKLLLGEAETKRVATLTQLLLKWAAADADPAQQQDDSYAAQYRNLSISLTSMSTAPMRSSGLESRGSS